MKKFSSKYLADTVLSARKAKKITQQQLADRTGINRSMLSHLEAGEYIPSIPQLEALSEVLEFDLTEAFFQLKTAKRITSPTTIQTVKTRTLLPIFLKKHHHLKLP